MYSEVVSAEDLDTAARTVWGEARGEFQEGRVAVAKVIVNRSEKGGWWGDTLKRVCLKPWQFSCWNESDPNREKMISLPKTDPEYLDCLAAVAEALVSDDTSLDKFYHYHTKAISPDWADEATDRVIVGNHVFLKGIK